MRPPRLHPWMLAACWLAQVACANGLRDDDVPVTRGVVYTYPVDQQRDVPLGAHLIVSFSDRVTTELGSVASVVGPSGKRRHHGHRDRRRQDARHLVDRVRSRAPRTRCSARQRASEPLFRFTTRSDRPPLGPAVADRGQRLGSD